MHERELKVLADRLVGLTDRVDDAGAAADRAEAAAASLARSLEVLVARHHKIDRALNLNSFVAYALFTLLLGGGFFALYRTRAADLVADRDRAAAARDAALARSSAALAELEQRDRAARQAQEVFQLHRDHRYQEALAAQAALPTAGLTASERLLLAESLERAHEALAQGAIDAARAASKAGDHAKAVDKLTEGLTHAERGPLSIQLRYHRGVALGRLGRTAEAEKELEAALAAGAEGQGVVEARFALADLYDRLRRDEDARREYRAFINRAPTHALARQARNRFVWLGSLPRPRTPLTSGSTGAAAPATASTPGAAPAAAPAVTAAARATAARGARTRPVTATLPAVKR